MPDLKISEEKLAESGLDIFKPGEVVYAQARLVLEGEGDQVSGVRVEAIGELTDSPEGDMISLYGETGPQASDGEGEEIREPLDESLNDPDPEEKSEEDILGYKRPGKPPSKLPSAEDVFGDDKE